MAIDPDVQPLLDNLATRISALEVVPPVDLSGINVALVELQSRVGAVEAQPDPVDYGPQITALAARVTATEALLAALNSRVNELERNPNQPSSGFTQFVAVEPSGEGSAFTGAGTRKIYVSSSAGDDANPGTEALPKKTVAAGKALLRASKPDWLLFKSGDVWRDQSLNGFAFSGPSVETPILISFYGDGPRPKFEPLTSWFTQIGGNTNGSNMAFVGLEIYGYKRDPANPAYSSADAMKGMSGISSANSTSGVLIEDCKFSFCSTAIVLTGATHVRDRLTVRRCIIVDDWCYPGGPHAQGIFISKLDHLVLEENYFDHNGWHNPLATTDTQLKFNHNSYLSDAIGWTDLKRNIFTDDASGGQNRSPGLLDDNLWFEHPYGTNLNRSNPAGKRSEAKNNVMLDFKTAPDGTHLYRHAWWSLGNSHLHDNIIANVRPVPAGTTSRPGLAFADIGDNNLIEKNVVFNWYQGIQAPVGTGNVIAPDNEIRLVGQTDGHTYPDPLRSVASYMQAKGLGNASEDFKAWHRARPRGVWDERYGAAAVNDYVREGFGKERV
jgi:hypothetical protein